jgi:hypothetical protein
MAVRLDVTHPELPTWRISSFQSKPSAAAPAAALVSKGARAARTLSSRESCRQPSGERLGLHQVDATQPRILRYREGAQGRRLRLTPQLGQARGELRRPREPWAGGAYDSRLAGRPARAKGGHTTTKRGDWRAGTRALVPQCPPSQSGPDPARQPPDTYGRCGKWINPVWAPACRQSSLSVSR